ncbi:oligosaccharide flippase family protein [Providencia sp. R33]|uniref:oligosaccharide flippase family protein n=1 Tax=Providencia sp. R33 TaxID=2828763 RepID=UPI001C5B7375|nr:oligosaccharide flippase family protein [Providencia sp. R33]QXX81930.1 oligosaccharide flippase family protein [Providencia sp. R33]
MNTRILKNAAWMVSEKFIAIIGLFFVTSYVAKYVGPSVFGIIALATATFQIIQIIAQLGNDNIIFKRVSKKKESGLKLIKSTFLIRTIIYFSLSIPTLYYFYSYKNNITFIFSIAICIACYFSSIDIYSIYNNAILKSKINTIANIIGLSIGLVLQYTIAYNKLDPIYLTIPIIVVTFIPLSIRFYLFPKISKITRKNKSRYNKYILLSGISIVFSTLSIAIYTRINQFMISYLEGDYNLGIYSVAVTLSTAWVFILTAIINSTLPSIFGEKKESKAAKVAANLNVIVIIISITVLAFIYFFGSYFINLLFGPSYAMASELLVILCCSTIFANLGTVSARFIVRHSGYSFLSKKMFIMVLLSIPISYTMIRIFGLKGAAYSVLVIEILSLTIMNYFFKKGLIFNLHKETLKLPKRFLELTSYIRHK